MWLKQTNQIQLTRCQKSWDFYSTKVRIKRAVYLVYLKWIRGERFSKMASKEMRRETEIYMARKMEGEDPKNGGSWGKMWLFYMVLNKDGIQVLTQFLHFWQN